MLLLPLAAGAAEEGACYLLMFGMQRCPNRVKFSHSMAVFVRTAGPNGAGLEVVTISWQAANMPLHPLRNYPEAGALMAMQASLQQTMQQGGRISMWGPYQIQPELFARASARMAQLSTGTVGYKTIDWGWRPGVTDCIHAISDIDTDRGWLHTRGAHGDMASYLVLHHLCRWIIAPCVEHDEILGALCLDGYPIIRRKWCWRPSSLLPILPAYYGPPQG